METSSPVDEEASNSSDCTMRRGLKRAFYESSSHDQATGAQQQNSDSNLSDFGNSDDSGETKRIIKDGGSCKGSSNGSGEDSKAISSMTANSSDNKSNSSSDERESSEGTGNDRSTSHQDSSNQDSSNQDSSSDSGSNEGPDGDNLNKSPTKRPPETVQSGLLSTSAVAAIGSNIGPSDTETTQQVARRAVAHFLSSRMSQEEDSNEAARAAEAEVDVVSHVARAPSRVKNSSRRRRHSRTSSSRPTEDSAQLLSAAQQVGSSGVSSIRSSSLSSGQKPSSSLSSSSSAFPLTSVVLQGRPLRDGEFISLQPNSPSSPTMQARLSAAAQDLVAHHLQQQQQLRHQQHMELTALLQLEQADQVSAPSTSSDGYSSTTGGQPSIPSSTATVGSFTTASTARAPQCRSVFVPTDENVLSEYQILIRKNIEFFEAEDVGKPRPGRKVVLVKGQVGIRCIHCRHVNSKRPAAATSYFPTKLHRLYHSAQTIAATHLAKTCPNIDPALRERIVSLQDNRQKAGVGKDYWATGARAVGVVETETNGLCFELVLSTSSTSS